MTDDRDECPQCEGDRYALGAGGLNMPKKKKLYCKRCGRRTGFKDRAGSCRFHPGSGRVDWNGLPRPLQRKVRSRQIRSARGIRGWNARR